MKFSIFNRPHFGVRSGIDIHAIAGGLAVTASVVVSVLVPVLGG